VPGARALSLPRLRSFGALAAVLAAAAALRACEISRESVWVDEALSVRLARLGWPALFAGTAEDGHPPLYLALLHVWIACFGTSEAAIRSLSAVLGVLAVAAVYAFGRVWFDQATGLCGALLVALSPYHIYYSQEARNYSLLVLTTASSYLGLALVRHRPGRASDAAYVVATLAMLYTHVFGVFAWIAQNLYVLCVDGGGGAPSRRRWTLLQAVVVAFLVPWLWGPWTWRLLTQAAPATSVLRLSPPSLGRGARCARAGDGRKRRAHPPTMPRCCSSWEWWCPTCCPSPTRASACRSIWRGRPSSRCPPSTSSSRVR